MKKIIILLFCSVFLFLACNVDQKDPYLTAENVESRGHAPWSYCSNCRKHSFTVYNVKDTFNIQKKVGSSCKDCNRSEYHKNIKSGATLMLKCYQCDSRSEYVSRNNSCRDLSDDGSHVSTYPTTRLKCNRSYCSRYGKTHDKVLRTGYSEKALTTDATENCKRCHRDYDHKSTFKESKDLTQCTGCRHTGLSTYNRVYVKCTD